MDIIYHNIKNIHKIYIIVKYIIIYIHTKS